MRKHLCLTMLLTLAVVASALSGAEKNEKKTNPTAKFEHGVVERGRLIGVDNRGHLISNNLNWGHKRDYGTLDRELGQYIDVVKDKACVITANEVCEVDLASGKVVRSAKHSVGIGGVGFIDANRVFVHNGSSMEIIDLASGKIAHKIVLQSEKTRYAKWFNGEPLIAHSRSSNLLYVARSFRDGVAVIDLNRGELVKEIKVDIGWTNGWTNGVHVAGEKLFMRHMMMSYGIVSETLNVVELATGKCRRIEFPSSLSHEMRRFNSRQLPVSMLASNDGGFFLTGRESIFRYNANGQLVGESLQALKNGKRLVASQNGQAFVADATSIRRIVMSPAKAAK